MPEKTSPKDVLPSENLQYWTDGYLDQENWRKIVPLPPFLAGDLIFHKLEEEKYDVWPQTP